MHRQKICYRDLKPENIMIDETGYPVFVDFGFAKYLPEGKTFTFCGTPAYTCPEIISNEGHGYAADHWALGVVIYEMISGESPFFWEGISSLQLLQDICNEEPAFLGDEYSTEVKDLIDRLLIKDPLKRLGSLAKGGKEITTHPWFEEVDLCKARQKQLPAPFLPSSQKK
jgi:protein kinase A